MNQNDVVRRRAAVQQAIAHRILALGAAGDDTANLGEGVAFDHLATAVVDFRQR
jgi:hypothetical protein